MKDIKLVHTWSKRTLLATLTEMGRRGKLTSETSRDILVDAVKAAYQERAKVQERLRAETLARAEAASDAA